jgi:signal transduction histidine kinase/ActR/RegA family two-component response regulator
MWMMQSDLSIETSRADIARRVWIVRMLIYLIGPVGLLIGLIFLFMGQWQIAVLSIIAISIGFLMLRLMQRSLKYVSLITNTVCLVATTAVIIGNWFSGGIQSPGWVWVAFCPILAVIVASLRWGFYIAILCIVSVLGIWAAPRLFGISPPLILTGFTYEINVVLDTIFMCIAVYILANVMEASRMRAFQELASARDAAEAATRAKADFLATMSHEIRTPMTGVLGALELLETTPQGSEQAIELQRTARASAEGLLSIINSILDFSKIEAGKLELECIAFNLYEVAREVVATLKPAASTAGLQLIQKIQPDVAIGYIGDPIRLRQILLNLMGNAIKFTEKGSITLAIQRLSVQGEVHQLCLEIIDTGVGIPADRIGSVFESFTQVDSSTTRRFGGTGLGLAIVKHLVDLYGGTVQVRSQLGQGTTFVVKLPLQVAVNFQVVAPVNEYHAVVAKAGSSHIRALVVDDNAVNQVIIRRMLERLGLSVEIAVNGIEAVEAANTMPDIIFMDQHMPEMDGLEATRVIRTNDAFKSIPIIALTAGAQNQDRDTCLAAGMNDFLSKPVGATGLRAKLERWTSWAPPAEGVADQAGVA